MPTYLMLTTLTEKGIQTLHANPARLREVNRDVEEMGAKVLHQWAALGAYDFVNIVEAPDDVTIAKVSVALGARGSAKLESLPLISVDDFLGTLDVGRPRRALQREESGLTRLHVERARGQAGLRFEVELARRDVVRRVGVEERGEQLDLASARPELPLTASVCADSVRLAVVVGGEEPLHGAEAGRLHVHRLRRPRQASRCPRPNG